MTDRDTYYNMSKLEWFVEGFRNIRCIVSWYGDDEYYDLHPNPTGETKWLWGEKIK